jgi:hypothetical protein
MRSRWRGKERELPGTGYIGPAEAIGLMLVGYGVWFTIRGVGMLVWGRRDWWRPLDRRKRYPYPVAGVLLGLSFALHYSWEGAPVLGYTGGGLFVLVFVIGVAQPRFLHPQWYRALEDRLGKESVRRLRAEAFKLEKEEWLEVDATDESFNAWVDQTAPQQRAQSRGYKKSE